MNLDFFVPGQPAPQGSKNPFINPKTGRIILAESSKFLKPWREDVRVYAEDEMIGKDIIPPGVPVFLFCSFVLKRPKYLTEKKPTPPATKRPDTDKLLRAIGDALTGVVYTDDSQVVDSHGFKRIAAWGEATGVQIRVGEIL